jgi:hypothetical protein
LTSRPIYRNIIINIIQEVYFKVFKILKAKKHLTIYLLISSLIIALSSCSDEHKNVFISTDDFTLPNAGNVIYLAFSRLPDGVVFTQPSSDLLPTPVQYSISGRDSGNPLCIISYTDSQGEWQVGTTAGTTYFYEEGSVNDTLSVNCGLAGTGTYSFTLNSQFTVGKVTYYSYKDFSLDFVLNSNINSAPIRR